MPTLIKRKIPISIPAKRFKRTKILATLGPATESPEIIEELIRAGVNGFRLNFSHGSHEEHKARIRLIRAASKRCRKPVSIVQDLQGPKIRVGILPQKIELAANTRVSFQHNGTAINVIPTQYDLAKKVLPGEHIFLNDGKIRTVVEKVEGDLVHARVEVGGTLTSRKGINLPDTALGGDILTRKDAEDLKFGAKNDIDYVALSFVQTAADVERLRKILQTLRSEAKIIAKIETKVATENLDEIVQACDAVMVARGDLAVETKPESVPIVQREIVGLAMKYGKIAIVATQMLASMVDSPEPTRAEVSDVATAVIIGADTVMLSEETAVGSYPVQAVKMMKRIIRYAEDNSPLRPLYMNINDNSVQSSISSAVMTLAHQVKASAIVAETSSGMTALSLASHRPSMPIIMVSNNLRVCQQLALVYGGKPYYRKHTKHTHEKMTSWLKSAGVLANGDIIVICFGRYPGLVGGTDTIKVRMI